MAGDPNNTEYDPLSGPEQQPPDLHPRAVRLVYLLVLPMLVIAAAVGVVLLSAATAGVLAYYWAEQILLAGSIALISAFAGSLVVAVTWRFCPTYLPEGLLAAIAARIVVTLGGIVVLVLCVTPLGKIFFLGVAGFYIIGLISETILAITLVRQGYMDQIHRGRPFRS